VFCGKGGVGKTTLSLAHGFWHADHGRRALVVTSHPLSELAVTISLHGLKERFPEAATNLLVVHIDPREVLGNRIRQQIPSVFLANKVLCSRLYQNLVEVAPGLKEIAFLARLKQLAERLTEGLGEAYDLLIWDAPATGHFLQIMKVSRNFDTYLSGPFALLGKELHSFFSNPAKIRLIPVTVLEEMAVDETIELCGELDNAVQLHPSALVCNLVSPLLDLTDEAFSEMRDRLAAGGLDAAGLKFALDRHITERELARKLQSSVNAVLHTVPRVPDWRSDLDLLVSISRALGDSLAGAPS
jgi:hypothetical protein